MTISVRRRGLCALRSALSVIWLASLVAACSDGDDPDLGSDSGSASAADAGSGDGAAAPSDALIVDVAQGKLEGKLVEGTRQFLGIPYAKPPVGALRFAPPEPAEKWVGTRPATAFGASCPQPTNALSAMGPADEDCLTLNVYAPVTSERSLPVMVFIHGGAFVAGGSVQYDGSKLAAVGPVVVVSVNYRLGALGFLAHPQLDQVRGGQPSGNDALRDQQLALTWVKDNIAVFGGDPANVTLFGESAGSTSTALQLVSPKAKGLARRYVMESGAGIGGALVNDKAKAQALGAELASVFCPGAADVVACLRTQPAQALIEWGADRGISGAGWGATVNPDDEVLPDRPLSLLTAGRNNKGEILIGSNKNEWELFLALGTPPALATVADLHAQIDRQFPEPALRTAVKTQYTGTDATARADFVRLMTDAAFRCPARVLARAIAAQGTAAYLYSFEEGRAWHALELPYVFGIPNERLLTPTLTEPLRAHLQGYWTAFAKGGDPNGGDRPQWPKYERASDQHLVLQMTSQVASGLAKADCDFWEPLLR